MDQKSLTCAPSGRKARLTRHQGMRLMQGADEPKVHTPKEPQTTGKRREEDLRETNTGRPVLEKAMKTLQKIRQFVLTTALAAGILAATAPANAGGAVAELRYREV